MLLVNVAQRDKHHVVQDWLILVSAKEFREDLPRAKETDLKISFTIEPRIGRDILVRKS